MNAIAFYNAGLEALQEKYYQRTMLFQTIMANSQIIMERV